MFRKEKLANGITVVMEQVKGVRSFTAGIWVKVGSRNESASKNGISHFLEHMFFKGTKKRSAREIAFEIDSLGGDLNAFTSKENTAFYVKVLDIHAEQGLDILTDLFCHSLLKQDDIEKERGVILEEIKMVQDTPDDLVHDLFSTDAWGEKGLGQPILGEKKTVSALARPDLLGHIKRFYGTVDTIVACAGNFEFDKVTGMLNEKLGDLGRGSEPKLNHNPQVGNSVHVYPKDLSEVHLCLGVEGLSQSDPLRYEYYILNTLFGAGLSSKLFQEIREKRGLVYTIYSFTSAYSDTGLWGVYAGTGRKKVGEVLDLITKYFSGMPDELTQAELDKSKDQLKGNLLLGLESSQSRMQNIAKQEIYFGKYFSPAEVIKAIDAVTLNSLKSTAERLIRGKVPVMTVLGPVEKNQFGKALPSL